jgi:hypothetical protein
MIWNGKIKYKPLILLQYITLYEAVGKNAYEIDEDFEEMFNTIDSSEEILEKFQAEENFAEANKYLAYSIHKRVGVWWAYQCVKMVQDEIEKAKLKKKEKRDVQKEIDAFVKDGLPEMKQLQKMTADHEKDNADMEAYAKSILNDPDGALKSGKIDQEVHDILTRKELKAFMQQLKNRIEAFPKNVKDEAKRMVEKFNIDYAKEYGMSFKEHAMQQFEQELMSPVKPKIDSSLLDKTMLRINDKINDYKQEIDQEMKKVPKTAADIPGLPKGVSKKKIGEAYESALHWILAPSGINAKYALNSGNAANGKMEGLLALCAFWAHGDLAVDQENVKQVLLTPPGLTSNGINSIFNMAAVEAVAEGVDISYDEFMEEFHKIGIEAAQGINLWNEEFIKTVKTMDMNSGVEGKPGIGRDYACVTAKPEPEPEQKNVSINNSTINQKETVNSTPSWVNTFKKDKYTREKGYLYKYL